jgi:hypothetical protein
MLGDFKKMKTEKAHIKNLLFIVTTDKYRDQRQKQIKAHIKNLTKED